MLGSSKQTRLTQHAASLRQIGRTALLGLLAGTIGGGLFGALALLALSVATPALLFSVGAGARLGVSYGAPIGLAIGLLDGLALVRWPGRTAPLMLANAMLMVGVIVALFGTADWRSTALYALLAAALSAIGTRWVLPLAAGGRAR